MARSSTTLKPGQTLPGAGRPKNAKDKFSVCELKKAFKRAKKNNAVAPDKNIYDWLAEKAYEDHTLAIALLKKIMPDLRQQETIVKYEGGYAEMTPAQACEAMDRATLGDKSSE